MLGFAPLGSTPIGSTQTGVLDATVPVMVGTLSSSAITATGFALSWSAATDNIGVTGYEVSIDNGSTYTNVGNVLTIAEASLAAGTLYNTKVRAYDGAGNRATPLSLAASTSAAPDSTAPTMTGSLTVSAITSSGFTLTWLAASDNVAVVGYEFSTDGGTTYNSVGNVLTYDCVGKAASTLYNVSVRAFDGAGNRATALTATATTAAPIPVGPTLPLYSKNGGAILQPAAALLSSTPRSVAFVLNSRQEVVLYNNSAGTVVVNIKGNDVVIPILSAGGATVSLTGGLSVSVTAGSFRLVALDKCYAYLQGSVGITANVDNVVTAFLVA